jgi:hypothetical protein
LSLARDGPRNDLANISVVVSSLSASSATSAPSDPAGSITSTPPVGWPLRISSNNRLDANLDAARAIADRDPVPLIGETTTSVVVS